MLLVQHPRFVEERTSPLAYIWKWNTRTLKLAEVKLKEVIHEWTGTDGSWNILGLCEMRWKNFGKTTTEGGHMVFFSGKEINMRVALDILFTRTS